MERDGRHPPPPRRRHHEPARAPAARRPTSTCSCAHRRTRPRPAVAPSPSSRSRHPGALPRPALDRRKIDLAMYATPALADDVADLATALWPQQDQHLRRLLRHALGPRGDAPPSRPGAGGGARRRLSAAGQRRAERARDRAPHLEQLYTECAADAVCRDAIPTLRPPSRAARRRRSHAAGRSILALEDGPQPAAGSTAPSC